MEKKEIKFHTGIQHYMAGAILEDHKYGKRITVYGGVLTIDAAIKMRDALTELIAIASPNPHECSWCDDTGVRYDNALEIYVDCHCQQRKKKGSGAS